MANRTAIGIDIGTTGVKAVAIGSGGKLLAESLREHDLICKRPGWAEEDPGDWWENTVLALQDLWRQGTDPASVEAVGVSGMVPALVMLDEREQPVRLSIQQNDGRTADELVELQGQIHGLFERTGSALNQQHVLPRLLWVKRHESEVFARTRRVLGSYDYIALRLTGVASLEANWAVESGLYDIHREVWIEEALAFVGLTVEALPPVNPAGAVIGEVTPEAARLTGLRPGTPVIAGSADHVASALAAGVRSPGDLLIKFGGAGDILYATDRCLTHPKLYIDLHDIPGLYLLNGCMAASGSLVKWFVREFVGDGHTDGTVFAQLDAEAAGVPPGSDGLVVLPYFLGEKTPLFDPTARGVFFGLTLSHKRGHLYRALLESVIYGFRHHLDVICEMGERPRRVLATNGGVKSRLWRQIAADVLGMPITSFRNHPGSALGVAYLAGAATGLFRGWSDVDLFLQEPYVTEPDPGCRGVYDHGYRLYRQIYEHLRPDFQLLHRGPICRQTTPGRGQWFHKFVDGM